MMFRRLIAGLALCLVACAPALVVAPSTVTTTAETLVIPPPTMEKFAINLHCDVEFNQRGREVIYEASQRWFRASNGRIFINLVWDLDFDDEEALNVHIAEKDAMMWPVLSDYAIVEQIEKLRPGTRPLAATGVLPSGSRYVVMILDRIEETSFDEIVTHEFGHVAGMPDIVPLGSIMSGADIHGWPVPHELTPLDIELCRKHRYCD